MYNLKEDIKNDLNQISEYVDGFIALGDSDFPIIDGNIFTKKILKRNKNIRIAKKSDYSVFLSYKGDIKLINDKNINMAIIGVLDPSSKIEQMEMDIVSKFAKNKTVIVSGLALGCDSIAHKVALKFNTPTIAILPSTIKSILPSQNSDLANQIVINGGLLISEYYKDAINFKEQISRYVQRDRLQALFSDMVILTASYSQSDTDKDKKLDSGSRHAMAKAKEYGIRVAVMYDEKLYDSRQFNLNKDFINKHKNGYDISEINKNIRNFKIITSQNAEFILNKFKEYLNLNS